MPSAPRRAILVLAALLVPLAGALPLSPPGAERWVVGFAETVPWTEGEEVAGARVVRIDPALRLAVLSVPAGAFPPVAGLSGVRYVEPDPLLPLALLLPNDPRWWSQYGPQRLGMPVAWETSRGSASVSICFTDSGVRTTHEDLAGRYLGGHDFFYGTPNPVDDNGHGTHVAGIALAGIDNGVGIAGVSGGSYYAAKVLNRFGDGYVGDLAVAIRWCADRGAHVISMSVGAAFGTSALQDAVRYAAGRGALQVASVGNGGCDPCVLYPAAYPEVVAVGCITETWQACSFSARGPQVELVAPGESIWSTYINSDQSYTSHSGTSMAAPHASGAAALLKSVEPGLSAADLRARLTGTAGDMGATGWDRIYGHGLVRVDRAVGNMPPQLDPVVCAPAPTVAVGRTVSCTLRATDAPGGLHYSVDWGDGTPPERVPAVGTIAAGEAATATHRYAAPGAVTITARATDTHALPATSAARTFPLTVQPNAAPSAPALACNPAPSPAGAAAQCVLRAEDDSDGLAFVVSWGDGTAPQRIPAAGFLPPGSDHVVRRAWPLGQFSITAHAVDDQDLAGATQALAHGTVDCSVDRLVAVPAPGAGQMVEGVTSRSEDLPPGCVGQLFELTADDPRDEVDVCWYAGAAGISCHRHAGNETGWVPAGATRARVNLATGDGGTFRLRVGLPAVPCTVDRVGWVPAPGGGIVRDGATSRLEALPWNCGGETYSLTATVPVDNLDVCWLQGTTTLRCDRTAGGEAGTVPEGANAVRILNSAAARGEFRLRMPAASGPSGTTQILASDDGEADAHLPLGWIDDKAVKWIEVPAGVAVDVQSVEILLHGRGVDCTGTEDGFHLLMDGVLLAAFHPCKVFPHLAAGWASLPIPRERYVPGWHRFEILDLSDWPRGNAELSLDTDSPGTHSEASADGRPYAGELMWRLRVTRN